MVESSQDLQKLLDVVAFTNKLQKVTRMVYIVGEERGENDSEHSFQLAFVAWYLLSAKRLPFNETKVIKYALAHDLVEAYSGDTFSYTQDKSLLESKTQREHAAAIRIQNEYPEFGDLHQIIEEYEQRTSPEAKFIYALDKILPVINIYLDQGRSWKRDSVSYEMIRTKDTKIAVSPEATLIWQEIINLLERDQQIFA